VKKKYVATSKDQKDWMDFTKKIDNISTKEADLLQEHIQINRVPKLDLHGSSLNEANRKVEEFVNESFNQGYRKLLIITGKGLRSKVDENPYISEKFSVLKYSVPEFIKNEENLNKKVMKISTADKKHGGDGAFYIFLKNNEKIRE
tara:strand:- start:74 stop:511 length:438 start_codon:yes stop_codon:yes gene_type:complete